MRKEEPKKQLCDGEANDFVKSNKKEKLRLPFAIKLIYALVAACIPLYLLFLLSESFSDFFNVYVSSGVRAILAHLTSWIPFSLAEFTILLLPVLIILLTRWIVKRYGDSWKELISGILCVCSILGVIFSAFTLGFAPAYRGTTLDKKLGLDWCEVSSEELYDTALILTELVAEESDRVAYDAEGFSIMPYGYAEMNERLLDAFDIACDEYVFLQRLDSRLKPVMLSEAMSYTHITGVYTFFTGEANINVIFPDYTIPFTAAHELSHQRGIARENEANFMAFLVCIESDDAYIRYSAYLNMLEYVMSALAGADSELYADIWYSIPTAIRGEMAAYSSFYDKYRDSTVSNVSEAVNDTFLKLHGTEGTKSYGMVVDLAVSYFKTQD